MSNLRYGTRGENNEDRVLHGTHHNSSKTECPRGHQLVAPNLRLGALANGGRQCRACGQEHSRAHHAREPFNPARANAAYARIMQEA